MVRLATLTAEEDKMWVHYFAHFVENENMTDDEADAAAWKQLQQDFPRLKEFDGCDNRIA